MDRTQRPTVFLLKPIMSYDSNNIFAKIIRGEAPCVKVYEDEHTFVMMDIMPQAEGHTLVLTKEPAEMIYDLSPEAAAACIQTTQRVAKAVRKALQPDGMMIAQFNGAAGGQTVFHVHFHILPRSNDTKMKPHAREMVDPATLQPLAERIRAALDEV